MSPVNKYEAIGIFLSVAVMAVALSMLRFQADLGNTVATLEADSQTALVVQEETATQENGALAQALADAATAKGKLVKLVIDDVKIGTGPEVTIGDTLTVDYIGSTQDGVQFDSSYARGEPFSFTVGENRVIQGWEKGVIGMQVGGQRILVIPSDMGYGDRQVGPIKAGSTLIFAVELLEIK
jgi:peptidylprolyl isomerase